MQYPNDLKPNSTEQFLIKNEIIKIPKCITEFESWNGQPIQNTFGNKPLLEYDGKPMFPELVIMNIFNKNGWNSRWVETYGKPKLKPIFLDDWADDSYKNQIHKPIDDIAIQMLLQDISTINDSNFSGCWDVVSWKGDFIIFTESKRIKKDYLRQTQNGWLNAAFDIGLSSENFLMVEWKTKIYVR